MKILQYALDEYEANLLKLTIGTFLYQNQNTLISDEKKECLSKLYKMFDEKLNTKVAEIPQPKPPKLDFGGLTVEDRMWRTVDGTVIVINFFNYNRRMWNASLLNPEGKTYPGGFAEFTEDGDNQELGYLKDRRRGSEKGWPSVVVGEVEGK